MNYLNLEPKKTEKTVEQLNVLLADYHMYYQKLRNFHWNVIGRNFFDLHEKFEELYDEAILKVDEIAERILTLRHQPISNYTDFLKQSNLKEAKSTLTDKEMITALLEDHGKILKQMSKVVNTADENSDEGTIDPVSYTHLTLPT